jgi:hypothetical protein
MNDLALEPSQFDSNPFYSVPLATDSCPLPSSIALFDQNGYDLSNLEIEYSKVNSVWSSVHRNHTHIALKKPWFSQPVKREGSVLNHALIFERKGYSDAALLQLEKWAQEMPLLWKIARIRPKWGIDFSIDWADRDGNVFEILHYEYDGFDYEEIQAVKQQVEKIVLDVDWDWAAQKMLAAKSEWHHLDFFAQSDYKCRFFGLGPERFKMVLWS